MSYYSILMYLTLCLHVSYYQEDQLIKFSQEAKAAMEDYSRVTEATSESSSLRNKASDDTTSASVACITDSDPGLPGSARVITQAAGDSLDVDLDMLLGVTLGILGNGDPKVGQACNSIANTTVNASTADASCDNEELVVLDKLLHAEPDNLLQSANEVIEQKCQTEQSEDTDRAMEMQQNTVPCDHLTAKQFTHISPGGTELSNAPSNLAKGTGVADKPNLALEDQLDFLLSLDDTRKTEPPPQADSGNSCVFLLRHFTI